MSDHMSDDPTPTDAELTRLADGTLPAGEREALRARARTDPELAAALHEQERAVSLMRSVDDVTAPTSLHASIEALGAGETCPPGTDPLAPDRDPTGMRLRSPRWRRRLFVPAATALAIIVAAIVVVAGGGNEPTVAQTARVALSAPTMPTPPRDPSNHELLALRVGSIPFPSYLRSVGWRPTGARRDALHGRRVTTVFYSAADGTRVGYAIVAGKTLQAPAGPSRTVNGVRYTFGHAGSARLVTWWRDGHTCVIAGRTVGDATLLALAAADEHAG